MEENELPEDNAPTENEGINKKSYKKQKTIAVAIVAIFLILGTGVYAAIYLFPQMLSPKIVYLLAEKQGMNNLQREVKEYLNDGFVKDSLKSLNTPFSNQSEFSIKLAPGAGSQNQYSSIKSLLDIISATKISINQTADYKNQKSKAEYIIGVKGNNIINTEVFKDKSLVGIKVPVLYDKYITFNGDNLAPVYEKFGITPKAKRIVTTSDVINAIKFDKNVASDIVKDYTKFYISLLKDKNFTFTPGVKLATGEGDIKCNKVAMKLTGPEMKEILVKLMEKASNDDKLLNLTAGNVINLMKLYEEAGYYGTSGIPAEYKDIDTVKKNMKKAVEDFKNDKSIVNENTQYVLTLFIDRNYNILQRNIESVTKDVNNNNAATFTVRLSDYTQPLSKKKANIVEAETNIKNAKSKFIFNAMQAPKVKGKRDSTVIVNVVNSIGNVETKPFSCKIDITDETVKNKSSVVNSYFELSSIAPDNQSSMIINGKVVTDASRNPSAGILSSKFNIDGNYRLQAAKQVYEMGLGFSGTKNIKFGVPVEVPKVDSSNSLDLNTATQAQIQTAYIQIQMALQRFLQQNQKIFTTIGA